MVRYAAESFCSGLCREMSLVMSFKTPKTNNGYPNCLYPITIITLFVCGYCPVPLFVFCMLFIILMISNLSYLVHVKTLHSTTPAVLYDAVCIGIVQYNFSLTVN